MVFASSGMINFAHGEVYMIGASYIAFMAIAALRPVRARIRTIADYRRLPWSA